jgi:hypothetical protein
MGNENRKITVQVSLGKKSRPYSKVIKAKGASTVAQVVD